MCQAELKSRAHLLEFGRAMAPEISKGEGFFVCDANAKVSSSRKKRRGPGVCIFFDNSHLFIMLRVRSACWPRERFKAPTPSWRNSAEFSR